MPDDTKPADGRSGGAGARAQAAESRAERPSDDEISFEHLIRNMIAARDEARRKRG